MARTPQHPRYSPITQTVTMHTTHASPGEPKPLIPTARHLTAALTLALILLTSPTPLTRAADPTSPATLSPKHASVLEATGTVLHSPAGRESWNPAQTGLSLKPGDRLQTGPDSRAALLLSDQSILRVSEQTLILIQTPKDLTALQRFRLILGKIFFFDREEPRRIEFETPLATGAIRGTEFILESSQNPDSTLLAMLDGEVSLSNELGSLTLTSGQSASVSPRSAPIQTSARTPNLQIQWTLYYPAILNPSDLQLSPEEQASLASTLTLYNLGNLPQALLAFPTKAPTQSQQPQLAAIKLAVGNTREARSILAQLPQTNAPVQALNILLAAIQQDTLPSTHPPHSAS